MEEIENAIFESIATGSTYAALGGALGSNPIGWAIVGVVAIVGAVCFGIWCIWKIASIDE